MCVTIRGDIDTVTTCWVACGTAIVCGVLSIESCLHLDLSVNFHAGIPWRFFSMNRKTPLSHNFVIPMSSEWSVRDAKPSYIMKKWPWHRWKIHYILVRLRDQSHITQCLDKWGIFWVFKRRRWFRMWVLNGDFLAFLVSQTKNPSVDGDRVNSEQMCGVIDRLIPAIRTWILHEWSSHQRSTKILRTAMVYKIQWWCQFVKPHNWVVLTFFESSSWQVIIAPNRQSRNAMHLICQCNEDDLEWAFVVLNNLDWITQCHHCQIVQSNKDLAAHIRKKSLYTLVEPTAHACDRRSLVKLNSDFPYSQWNDHILRDIAD
jgi:hypothetical protein